MQLLLTRKITSLFFKAASEIHKSNPDVHFLVVGDGPLRPGIEREVSRLKIEDFVTFTNFIDQPERIIPQVDVLLFTSRFEGLGSTILDFFVYKKPVVSTRNGGAEEIIQHGETGLLSKIGDFKDLAGNVVKLLNDPVLTKKITEQAYKYVLKYHSPSELAIKTLEVYKSLEFNS
ncbi:glycosyltransferase family 4 protein [Anaerophaga thermohalophila]|uniref:glycosyltransferase family 4 protein n=1 Tax=Anaerophaga thermohalophila TaxID=177400 RepID=UPI00037BDA88|nr:glycosyltransferase family 4 protein [Anaerophaga thermohalophila]